MDAKVPLAHPTRATTAKKYTIYPERSKRWGLRLGSEGRALQSPRGRASAVVEISAHALRGDDIEYMLPEPKALAAHHCATIPRRNF
jgi:hypothetical protein